MSVWYIQTVTVIITKLAVYVTKSVPFQKSIVEVRLESPHVEKRKTSLRIEIPSNLLTIKCPVCKLSDTVLSQEHKRTLSHSNTPARPRRTILHDWTGMSKYVGVLA
jgi:phage FluMu protein Com